MNIKTETWAGHHIRFVEKEQGEWWAVAKDVAEALEYIRLDSMLRKVQVNQKDTHLMSTPGGNQEISIVSEKGLYEVIMRSRKKEAVDFQNWVYDILKSLRQSAGVEGFQIFRMLDKDHQKEMMSKLNGSLRQAGRIDFIKANTIANKAVSTMHGYSKMVKKDEMSPEMLTDRQPILEDTVNLMGLADKYCMDISVSQSIYNGLNNRKNRIVTVKVYNQMRIRYMKGDDEIWQ